MNRDDAACAAALASLGIAPARLRRVLAGRSPRRAWDELAAGVHPEDPTGRLRGAARLDLPATVWRRCASAGVTVVPLGAPAYPASLADDPEAPAVLFVTGDAAALDAWPRVAVVGTRSATTVGREVAHDMGRHLAAAQAVVVSGLAPGIDSAALSGASEVAGARAVAVLGAAHDALSTPEQRRLAGCITEAGCVVSELPPGTDSARWRFAVRNRVMAALAQLVVVVECHVQGGALHTVRAARRRRVPVAGVPGPLRSSSSAGTNQLLVDGAACVRHGSDAASLLARLSGWQPAHPVAATGLPARPDAVVLDPSCAKVLEALDHDPVGLDAMVLRTGKSLSSVSLALERLAEAGLASAEGGFWTCRGRGPGRR